MKNIRSDFPILKKTINTHPLIYLDNAATSQKPQPVIDALTAFYTQHNTNVHRGVYAFAEEATTLYENARVAVARFLNAAADEIVFTSGTTHGINAVAFGWALHHIHPGDEILLTELEHHSNLVVWQQIAHMRKAHLKFIPVLPDGTLDLSSLDSLISKKTKLVSMIHVSNAVGTHNPIEVIIKAAHAVGAYTLVDAAQSAPHQKLDVAAIGCDFLLFSGHKMLGPTGIGVLYIASRMHDQMQPYQFGGGMVYDVDYQSATWQKAPHKFEAGTPPIAQAIGLQAAIEYLHKNVNFDQLRAHEAALCARVIDELSTIKKITLLGPIEQLRQNGHLVSFTVDGMHAHDVAEYLNKYGVCVRAGHHCAQPLAKKLGIAASVRASFYAYNTMAEVERFLELVTLIAKK
jgi:cysteine desulfurase/selenocysteine lyase